jgi:hypothetical protein
MQGVPEGKADVAKHRSRSAGLFVKSRETSASYRRYPALNFCSFERDGLVAASA